MLSACRVLAYVRGAGTLSKAEAAEWALGELPTRLRPAVAAALESYRSGADEPLAPDDVRRAVDEIAALVAYRN